MNTIWKYPIQLTDRQKLKVSQQFRVLSAQFQGNTPCLWVATNTEAPLIELEIVILGTGHEVTDNPRDLIFINTVHQSYLVWHFFYKIL